MPIRKRKPVEANDGSYAGTVLGYFDAQEAADQDVAAPVREPVDPLYPASRLTYYRAETLYAVAVAQSAEAYEQAAHTMRLARPTPERRLAEVAARRAEAHANLISCASRDDRP